MKKNNLLKPVLWFVFVLLMMQSCREESTTINDNNQRTKEFFNNTTIKSNKTSKTNQQDQFFEIVEKINNQQNFLSKISDKKGLPSWEFSFSKKFSAGSTAKVTDSEILYIPLKENDKNYLSSILFVKNPNSQNPKVFSITNNELLKYIKNDKIDLKERENLLLTFLSADKQIFGDRKYNNIPHELFENIKTLKKYKSFFIKQKDKSSKTARYELDCVQLTHCTMTGKCASGSCDGCNLCVSYKCSYIWSDGGGYSGSSDGDSTGSGFTGGSDGGSSSGTTSSTPWYLMNPNVDIYSYNSYVRSVFKSLTDFGIVLEEEQLDLLQENNLLTTNVKSKLVLNSLEKSRYIKTILDFILENKIDFIESEKIFERIDALDYELLQNPNKLLNIPCTQLPNWQDIATHQIPQSVKTKLQNIPNQNSYWSSWNITDLDDGAGARINMDLFPIKISTMPNKPNSTQKYTPAEFFDFFRKNINLFAEKFTPIEDNYYNIHDTALWNSSNPLGSLIHINIPIDDGTVICSGFSTNTWIFSTIKAPLGWSYDGIHPVSGNRAFSYYMEGSTMYIYTRGVDRTSYINNDNTPKINYIMEAIAFAGADDLWSEMQNKLSTYVNNRGGSSNPVTPVKYRPNYEKIKNYLKGQIPLSSVGCN